MALPEVCHPRGARREQFREDRELATRQAVADATRCRSRGHRLVADPMHHAMIYNGTGPPREPRAPPAVVSETRPSTTRPSQISGTSFDDSSAFARWRLVRRAW